MFLYRRFLASCNTWPNWLRILPMTAVMGSIFYLSHQPGSTLDLPDFPFVDKILHCLAYGALGLSVCFALPQHLWSRYSWLPVIGTVLFCILYGITDEVHQIFIVERYPSWADVLADGVGATGAAFSYRSFGRLQ